MTNSSICVISQLCINRSRWWFLIESELYKQTKNNRNTWSHIIPCGPTSLFRQDSRRCYPSNTPNPAGCLTIRTPLLRWCLNSGWRMQTWSWSTGLCFGLICVDSPLSSRKKAWECRWPHLANQDDLLDTINLRWLSVRRNHPLL